MNLKQGVRRMFFRALGLAGVARALHARNRRAGRIPVIVFHRVSPNPDPFWPPYTPEEFGRLMGFLAKHYRFISVEDLLAKPLDDLRGGIVITFDDAWHDFVVHALPVLREHQVPTVQFVATGPVQERVLIWTSLLDQAIRHTGKHSLELTVGGLSFGFALNDEAQRIRAALEVQRLLKQAPEHLRLQAFNAILEQLGQPRQDPEYRLCTWEELRTLSAEVPLHAHSATHPYLPHVEDDGDLEVELGGCQRWMETELGTRPRYLAYPMGGFDARVLARTTGAFEAAFATGNTLVDLERLRQIPDYRFRIPRFNLTDTEPQEAYLRLNGFHEWLFRLVGKSS